MDAKESDSPRALAAMSFIHQLYEVERLAKDSSATERQALRRRLAAPVLVEFEKWIRAQAVLPKSPLGEAIGYTLNQWKALNRYLEDGDYQIDNNGAERALRKVAIGRRNYLHFATETGGDRAAILYSIIESCSQNNVEPFAYLRDVLERIATHPAREVHFLMPRLHRRHLPDRRCVDLPRTEVREVHQHAGPHQSRHVAARTDWQLPPVLHVFDFVAGAELLLRAVRGHLRAAAMDIGYPPGS